MNSGIRIRFIFIFILLFQKYMKYLLIFYLLFLGKRECNWIYSFIFLWTEI
jgi:hypothetical protein